LKVKEGRFVLADLDSTAGTRVNGRLIKEHVLRPGDVINIAGIEMIYGEDVSGPPEEVPPYQPPVRDKADRDRITPLDLKTLGEMRNPKATGGEATSKGDPDK
jgi:pSer/pThr/pTyr-binding forkhead associated (FHA) protein